MSDRDYYEILGLTPGADGAMVDQAYWHLARKYQAQAATDPRGHALLDALNEAYGVLGNPRLREQYDAFRDDVLLRRGMIRPVPAKQKQQRAADGAAPRRASGTRQGLSHVGRFWRIYASSGVIAALALAGLWQGVNLLFVEATAIAGLAILLTPILRQRVKVKMPTMPAVALPSVSMPNVSMPSVSLPQVEAPKFALPPVPDVSINVLGGGDDALDADELRASTAATIARWRQSIGLRGAAVLPGAAPERPDTSLVDIVQGERELDAEEEPLAAVLEILRGARKTPRERTPR